MHFRFILPLAVALTVGNLSYANNDKAGDIHVAQAYARATVPHQPTGAAYLTLENKGRTSDKLISASSPVAKEVELHTMSMEGNVMRMREVSDIEIKPESRLEMKQGDGYHLMLMGLQQPLKAGERFPLTLTFEKAGKTEVSVSVRDIKGTKAHGSGHGH